MCHVCCHYETTQKRQWVSALDRPLVSVNLSHDRYTYGKPVPGHVKISICLENQFFSSKTETGCKEVNSTVSESIQRPVLNAQG